jgi:hypothetical protein
MKTIRLIALLALAAAAAGCANPVAAPVQPDAPAAFEGQGLSGAGT